MEIDRPVFPGMFQANVPYLICKTIQHGLRVRIEPLGITGASYLNFDYVNPERYSVPAISWTPEYTYIPSAPGEVTGLLDSVNKIMRDLETINLGNMAENLSLLFDNVNRAINQLQVQKLREDTDALIVQLRQAAKDAQLAQISLKASEFFDRSFILVENLDKTNRTLEQSLKRWDPIASESNETLKNLRITSENLRQVSQDIKTRPSLLLYGTPTSQKKTQ